MPKTALLAWLLVLVLAAVSKADDDRIAMVLNAARESYAATVDGVQEKLLLAIDDEIKRAAASGSLELVKSLQQEKASLEADINYEPKAPRLKPHTNRRTIEIKAAKEKLRTLLTMAKVAYTKQLKIAEAEAVDAELKALNEATIRTAKSTGEPKPEPKQEPKVPTDLKAGLAVVMFDRLPEQQGNDGYVDPMKLGKPTSDPIVIESIGQWIYDPDKNAIAFGFLRIDNPGEYHFRTYNFYDRNALFVAGQLVCPYRGSVAGGSEPSGREKIVLRKGMFPIMSVGYVDARGSVDVTWKPPGQKDFSPIPNELLFHESKDGSPVIPKPR